MANSLRSFPRRKLSSTIDQNSALKNYYYSQFNSAGLEIKFYDAIKTMYLNGDLETGVTSIDMVEEGYLTQDVVDANAMNNLPLVYALGAAKEAFRLDYPECYYVDLDKISIRSLSGTKNGQKINLCLLGIGRTDNYLRDGWDAARVASTKTEYETLLNTAVEGITGNTQKEKILEIHDYVVNNMVYNLELYDGVTDVSSLRTAYGALKNHQGMCETFAILFKVMADKVNIPCIGIIGKTYQGEDDGGNEHMWNNCYLDGKWWMVDTTWDNGMNNTYYRVVDGRNISTHVPDKYVSEGKYPFIYPSVYIEPSIRNLNWTCSEGIYVTEEGNYASFNLSYLGKGYRQLMAEGLYIVYKYRMNDGDYPSTWTGVSYDAETDFYPDFGNYFLVWYEGASFNKIKLGVTTIPTYYAGVVNDSDVYDVTDELSNNNPRMGVLPPYVIKATPHSQERLEIGKSYNISFEYDEDLELTANLELEVTHTANITLRDLYYENLQFDGVRTITFKFFTSKRFETNTIFYTFIFKNIRGRESKLAPVNYQLFVLIDSNIGCPLKYGITYQTFGQATLLENRDLRTTGWQYEDEETGELKTVNDDLSVGVSLVVSKPSTEVQNTLNGKISTSSSNVRTTEIYDISLKLCCIRMKFLPNGQRVKIMIPFPAGYGPDDAGVDFEAYHYNRDTQQMELVTCLVTEGGITLYIDKFSPFAIVVVNSTETSSKKGIMTITNEGGKIDTDLVELSPGENYTFTLTPATGKVVDYATLDGNIITVTDNKINVKYEDITSRSAVLEVYFITESTKENEQTQYNATILVPTAETPNVVIEKINNDLVSTVTGNLGNITYTWYKDDQVISGEKDSNYSLKENEAGTFKLVVANMVLRSTAKGTSNAITISSNIETDNNNHTNNNTSSEDQPNQPEQPDPETEKEEEGEEEFEELEKDSSTWMKYSVYTCILIFVLIMF